MAKRGARFGEAVFTISLNEDQVRRALGKLEGRITRFGRQAAAGFQRAAAGVAAFGRTLTRIGSLGFLGGRGPAGLITGAFAGFGAGAALTYPIRLAANIEIAAAQLGVFAGGMENARSLLFDLQRFSAKAFIPPEALAENTALLLKYGVGVEAAVKSSKALATVSAGSADELSKLSLAFAQVASTGHLTGEEVRQFKNTAFNPLTEIAEETGETFQQLRERMEAGRIGFDEVAAALDRAVGPGGRFHGLLEAIADTAIGRFRKAIAQIKLALIPLGETVLPPITDALTKISDLLPSLTRIISKNAALYKQLLIGVLATAALGTAFVTLGITITLAANMAAAFAGVISLLASTIGFLLFSKVGLAVTALGTLATLFVTSTRDGQNMVRVLKQGFSELGKIASDAIGGIADALAAGDMELAARIMFTGLRAAWLSGTEALRQIWRGLMMDMQENFTATLNVLQSVLTKFTLGAAAIFNDIRRQVSKAKSGISEFFAVGFEGTFGDLKRSLRSFFIDVEFFAKRSLLPPFPEPGTAKGDRLVQIENERALAEHKLVRERKQLLKAIVQGGREERAEAERQYQQTLNMLIELDKQVDAHLTRRLARQMQELAKEENERHRKAMDAIRAEKKALDDLVEVARHAREQSQLPAGGLVHFAGRFPIPSGRAFQQFVQQAAAAGVGAAASGARGIATFDPRMVHLMTATERVQQSQLAKLREIAKSLGLILKVHENNTFSFSVQP